MFHSLSIKQKLLLITILTVAVSLLLAGIGVVISDSILFREGMRRDLTALANIVGDNSTAALAFDDARVATETLAALRARPYMVAACIFKKDGVSFASYVRSGADYQCDAPGLSEELRFTATQLVVSHPILLDGKPVGTLVMHYDLGEAAARTRRYIEIVLLILLGSSVIAFMLSARLRRLITTPISNLASAASSVSKTGDYSVRVEENSRDELGVLVESFNKMLARVQSRDLEIENARDSLQTTLSSIGDAVISIDADQKIVFFNPAAQTLLGLANRDLTGKPIEPLFHVIDEQTRVKWKLPFDSVLRGNAVASTSHDAVLVAADATERPIDYNAAPIRNARGEVTGVVLVFRDITDRRATEKTLEMQADELRQRAQLLKDTDERKDQFLAMLGHELRNPLAAIRNALEVMKRPDVTGSNLQRAGNVVERQAKHLTRLVDDLLDVSRITRGKVSLKKEILDLSAIVNSAVEMSTPLIQSRKHQLELSLPEEPVYVDGDLTRLAQVVGNILNNAAKFMLTGGWIGLKARRDADEIVIHISDKGIGIPTEMLPRVFDLFAQADRSLDRSEGGLGIGLTLARGLVEMHGGHIEARSPGPGQGSEFIIRLPASDLPTQPTAVKQQSLTSSVRMRILILEDHADSAEMLRFMLEVDSHEVRVALDGIQGVAMARDFAPHILLCDIGLPGINGYEVATRFRSDPALAHTRLIAVSGYGQEEDRTRSRQAGFDYHLTKPVEPTELFQILASLTANLASS